MPPASISSMNRRAMCFGSAVKVTIRSRGIGGTPSFSAVLVALVGERLDQADLAAHVATLGEQRRADDEDVDAERADELGRLAVDAAVDVDLAAEDLVGEQLAGGKQLRRRDVPHERLAAEARLDGHDHHDVEELLVRPQALERRGRAERQAGRTAGRADRVAGSARSPPRSRRGT